MGIPTSRSIVNVRAVSSIIPLIATGGLRNGVDLARAITLAHVGAMARPFLFKATEGEGALDRFIADTLEELRICRFGLGAENVAALRGGIAPAGTVPAAPHRADGNVAA